MRPFTASPRPMRRGQTFTSVTCGNSGDYFFMARGVGLSLVVTLEPCTMCAGRNRPR